MGKFLGIDGARFLVKGVTYGTFAPHADGRQFPDAKQIASDFALMAAHVRELANHPALLMCAVGNESARRADART